MDGERTDTLYPAGHDGPLTLRRFASAVSVTFDGAAIAPGDVRLVADGRDRPGGVIEPASGAWGDVVTITSAPDDEAMKRWPPRPASPRPMAAKPVVRRRRARDRDHLDTRIQGNSYPKE